MLVINIFTAESSDDVQAKGGTFSWKLNARKANLCTYAILYQNARARIGLKGAAHGVAFLVGRISGLKTEESGRHAIMFDAIAEPVGLPDWPKYQNPINYDELDDQAFDGLHFQSIENAPEPAAATGNPPVDGVGGVTIATAKKLLANHYGVSPEAIEIVIRG